MKINRFAALVATVPFALSAWIAGACYTVLSPDRTLHVVGVTMLSLLGLGAAIGMWLVMYINASSPPLRGGGYRPIGKTFNPAPPPKTP